MALCYKWDVKNSFADVLTFFSLISDSLGGVKGAWQERRKSRNCIVAKKDPFTELLT